MSWGDLIDRLIILELKVSRVEGAPSSALLSRIEEYNQALEGCQGRLDVNLTPALRRINGMLWRLETMIRTLEKEKNFSSKFICTSRMISRLNDRRAKIKADIDQCLGAGLIEFKSYSSC
jgi:hypothetical protein